MSKEQLSSMIKYLTCKFAEFYSYFPQSEKKGIEYNGSISLEDELSRGYCLHYAAFLKKIFPEGQIYLAKNFYHYIFQYDENFYDYRGLIGNEENIEISPNFFINKKDLFEQPIENIHEEFQKTPLIYAEKDPVWSKIEPKLLELAEKLKKEGFSQCR